MSDKLKNKRRCSAKTLKWVQNKPKKVCKDSTTKAINGQKMKGKRKRSFNELTNGVNGV